MLMVVARQESGRSQSVRQLLLRSGRVGTLERGRGRVPTVQTARTEQRHENSNGRRRRRRSLDHNSNFRLRRGKIFSRLLPKYRILHRHFGRCRLQRGMKSDDSTSPKDNKEAFAYERGTYIHAYNAFCYLRIIVRLGESVRSADVRCMPVIVRIQSRKKRDVNNNTRSRRRSEAMMQQS